MNPLQELYEHKQSYWLDFIQRSLMTSGELKAKIENDGCRGMTSNPTIFQKAFESGDEYDAAIKKYGKKYKTEEEIFEPIAIEDIQKACDVMQTVYKSSQGTDGFVSLEVSPRLAFKTKETLEAAKWLHKRVKRPNLMIKIPGTPEGLPAIEEATALGMNINITLLFSVDVYKKVFDAYLKGLERRVKKKQPIKNIQSVASFFVSRVDTIIDKQLDALIEKGGSEGEQASQLLHKIAVANAKLAYQHYEQVIASPRFKKLEQKGAHVQRLLWASTGTKDKRLSDVYYIEELVGKNTVNTMPPATADAFRDHGTVRETLTEGWDVAHNQIQKLTELNVSLEEATQTLQEKGVASFIHSYEELLRVVRAKRELLLGHLHQHVRVSMGELHHRFEQNLQDIEKKEWIKQIWNKEATLWKKEEAHVKIIKNSLGWLTVPDVVLAQMDQIEEIKKSIKKGKFSHILLLGMGGSSLCPEVLRLTFGKKNGFPDLAILDSTEPASVLAGMARSKPEKTLFIVASKSGTTIEPNSFFLTFYNEVKKKKGAKAGENFIAITDPGTMMESLAKEKKFRHVVLNPPDIGGRYSALSFFGMLPAALMGIDVKTLLLKANQMAGACAPLLPVEKNPGALVGTAAGTAARAGKNKITFFLSKDIGSFGTWVEQLIAESTGKEGVGLLPVESEKIQAPASYGKDRLFVSIQTTKGKDAKTDSALKELEKAGHPVVRITLKDKLEMGAEFFRWEMATAIVGAFLKINPFDQPNVQEAKDLAKQLISDYKSKGDLPYQSPIYEDDEFKVYTTNGHIQPSSLQEALESFLGQTKEQDYVALLAFLTRNRDNDSLLQSIRHLILKSKKVATTVGFGPRYLHSTGQLHKGGDNHGVFITLTGDDKKDLPIPGESYSFRVLKEAQAKGDTTALFNKNRRILHIHLKNPKKGLSRLQELLH